MVKCWSAFCEENEIDEQVFVIYIKISLIFQKIFLPFSTD